MTAVADVLDSLVAATALGGIALAAVLGVARATIGRRRLARRARGGLITGSAAYPTLRRVP